MVLWRLRHVGGEDDDGDDDDGDVEDKKESGDSNEGTWGVL